MNTRKVLIIAYIYPPLGGSGVQRTLKFSKYLHEFGWQPYIVCCEDPENFNTGLDPTLSSEIPENVKVWREPFISPYGLRRKVQGILGIKPKDENGNHPVLSKDNPKIPNTGRFNKFLGWFGRILNPLENPPIDDAIYWSLSIIPLCIKIIRDYDIDIIYTTSFPYSDHVAGIILKTIVKKPWVADFRDPWTQNATYQKKGWRRLIDVLIEKEIIDKSDIIIGVTPTYTEALSKLSKNKKNNSFVTIENGYDQKDFDENLYIEKNNHDLLISHIGFVYPDSTLPFLCALEKFYGIERKFSILFVGGVSSDVEYWLNFHPISYNIKIIPRVQHSIAIEYMLRSNVLILFIGGTEKWLGHYPGKLFEYLASGTPILLVGPDGDASRLIRESRTGFSVQPNNQDAIVEILELILNQPDLFINKYFHPEPEVITRYERRLLTGKLASVFNDLVNKP